MKHLGRVLVGIIFSAWLAQAQQSAAKPTFEVATIKLNKDCGSGRRVGQPPSPGRLNLECISVKTLIEMAYVGFANGLSPNFAKIPILGGPSWMNSDQYDINAKAETALPITQMLGPLLQALLEERFQLKHHSETKELPVYFLTVAKGGPKLPRTKDGSCTPLDYNHLPSAPAPGETRTQTCGPGGGSRNGQLWTTSAHGVSIDFLIAGLLANYIDRPIIDKTGLTGLFDYLEFVGDTIQGSQRGSGLGQRDESALWLTLALRAHQFSRLSRNS